MAKFLDPSLINDPFEDPGLFVDLTFEKRALLFDLGDISSLPTRKVLRVTHAFISHRHMDHFIGFDRLLRFLLGREKEVHFWGPPGLISAIDNKLSAYDWNLVANYEGSLTLKVSEVDQIGKITSTIFSGNNRFARETLIERNWNNDELVADPSFLVRTKFLEHGIPVLGFALQERARINIWRNQVEAMGLTVGPWLNDFKDAILRGEDETSPIPVLRSAQDGLKDGTLPLGLLKSIIMKVTEGRKIAYVVDCAYSERNIEAIVHLAKDADFLFIESPFLHEDLVQAAARMHLTAKQAGQLARLANVKQLRTFHYSPRYRGRETELIAEANAAFSGNGDTPLPRTE